jgi:hypothetical protein
MNEKLSQKYLDLHVKYLLLLWGFKQTWISQHIFEKSSNIKFHENMSSGSRADGSTDTTKLIVAFCSFVKALKEVVP